MCVCVCVCVCVCACHPPHLFRALPLHLRGAWCWSPEHAGCDADGQVEGVHLVVVGIALDTVQHGDHVSQQEQVLAGQEVEQPEREEDGEGGSRAEGWYMTTATAENILKHPVSGLLSHSVCV